MIIKKKWVCVAYSIIGVIIALANAVLFLMYDRTVWPAIMILAGIGFLYIGVSNLRRLQQTGE